MKASLSTKFGRVFCIKFSLTIRIVEETFCASTCDDTHIFYFIFVVETITKGPLLRTNLILDFQQLKALASLSEILKQKSGKDVASIIPQWVSPFSMFCNDGTVYSFIFLFNLIWSLGCIHYELSFIMLLDSVMRVWGVIG